MALLSICLQLILVPLSIPFYSFRLFLSIPFYSFRLFLSSVPFCSFLFLCTTFIAEISTSIMDKMYQREHISAHHTIHTCSIRIQYLFNTYSICSDCTWCVIHLNHHFTFTFSFYIISVNAIHLLCVSRHCCRLRNDRTTKYSRCRTMCMRRERK